MFDGVNVGLDAGFCEDAGWGRGVMGGCLFAVDVACDGVELVFGDVEVEADADECIAVLVLCGDDFGEDAEYFIAVDVDVVRPFEAGVVDGLLGCVGRGECASDEVCGCYADGEAECLLDWCWWFGEWVEECRPEAAGWALPWLCGSADARGLLGCGDECWFESCARVCVRFCESACFELCGVDCVVRGDADVVAVLVEVDVSRRGHTRSSGLWVASIFANLRILSQ